MNQTIESTKAYVCLFTCASTRAVHLELIPILNVDSFLLAFHRFASRRGLPSTLLSDNAKTFKSACKEVHNIVGSTEISAHLTQHRVTWNFIAEHAPWWRGFWEWMVQLVKRSLHKAIGRSTLTFDQLNTVLVEVEAIINLRPLTYVYDDIQGVSYSISPSQLLYGRWIIGLPNSKVFEVTSTHKKHTLNQFLSHWRRMYLMNLREYHRVKRQSNRGPEIYSCWRCCDLKNDSTKCLFCRLAIVQELLTGDDGKVGEQWSKSQMIRINHGH